MDDGDGSVLGTLKINVKFNGRSIPIAISEDSTVSDLKSLLQPLTNVLIRGQRLIFKGKVLKDDMTLKSSEISYGCKIMLVASQGLHQGDGPIIKEGSEASRATRPTQRMIAAEPVREPARKQLMLEHWKRTGVIPLQVLQLEVIPTDVWNCGTSARVLDLTMNRLREIPAQIGDLRLLQKLYLNANELEDSCICWEAIASLNGLKILSLDKNYLTTLPSSLGGLTNLKELHLTGNRLSSLPIEIGFLSQLQILKANSNRLTSIPSSVGDCNSLAELDLASNLLSELPETLGNLRNLKVLHLTNNGLKSVPSTLLKKCSELVTLVLHGTEITEDVLRRMEGWEEFDARRRSKHQKQIDFGVGLSSGFDECADGD
ncbi:hypothetical protein Scep_005739 [Stephania cephalantha]|uniref:Ubiquitin-like domain-containing protein n=1 Tax=Stephania cephalantha TaxID=152367 RepID=A0AAP0KXH6_9MAGN